jgi:hypothetical protein
LEADVSSNIGSLVTRVDSPETGISQEMGNRWCVIRSRMTGLGVAFLSYDCQRGLPTSFRSVRLTKSHLIKVEQTF